MIAMMTVDISLMWVLCLAQSGVAHNHDSFFFLQLLFQKIAKMDVEADTYYGNYSINQHIIAGGSRYLCRLFPVGMSKIYLAITFCIRYN